MTGPRYTDLAASLPATVPFVGPETQERETGMAFRARLGANENVFGPSPNAIDAMCRASAEVWKYGDAQSWDLRQAMAQHLGIKLENLVIGGGIDGLLCTLVRLVVAQGDAVVTSAGAYPTFNYHVTGFGGQLHQAPYRDDHEDPDALIALARQVQPKLIYIANPDNPMGTWHNAEKMQALIEAVPQGSLLVLDEAYIEFAPAGTAPAIDIDDPRVIRLRTFSKAYGMAGARVGYAIGAAPLIAAFDRVRDHFGLSRTSQIGALAALQDQAWLRQTQALVSAARQSLVDIAAQNGLACVPSATNFVAIDCGHDGGFARCVRDELIALGVFVRMPFSPPGDRCIRVSAGTAADLAIFGKELPKALSKARETAL